MATRQEQRIPMSWDDYEALGDDVWGEYIDGSLVVSPLPGYRHQVICHELVARIKSVLPPRYRVASHWGWKPAADEFGPDVIVCDDGGDDRRLTGVPHLVVEVLSSNRSADTVRKLRKYAEAGVLRYWIVDPVGPEVIVFERNAAGDLVETARHFDDEPASLDTGPARISLAPSDLLR